MTAGGALAEIEFRGQRCIQLRLSNGDRVIVARFGAHVLSWQTADGQEKLYLSPEAVMDGSAPIRGGVPICFPQFNQRVLANRPAQNLPKHGFVRTQVWSLQGIQLMEGCAEARLGLRSSPDTLSIWPHSFAATLTVRLEPGRLRIGFEVENTGPEAWPFALALHSYLQVDHIAATRVAGLGGLNYWDAVRHLAEPDVRAQHGDEPLFFTSETDRVYAAVQAPVELMHGAGRLCISQSETLSDIVLWNPGEKLCASIADLPEDGWMNYVCIEAAQINDSVLLAPGQSWAGWQQLDAMPV